jgi:dihydrofolate synthase/folylpolyglutamate synthase
VVNPTETAPRRAAALDWLLGRINYERTAVIPYQERQLKLDRMRQLLTRLGSPDAGMRIVHIAGTKGKGSTAKMTAAVLTASGYRTGVYSSPHLERIEERYAVDGQPCSAEDLVALVDRIRPVVEAMDQECGSPAEGPTFFDVATAMAFVHFADRQVDAAVVEVGLGGRLDSTNVCTPVVSVITSISRDHTKQLGETLPEIAGEKAGIIKPGVPAVSGVTQPAPREVIRTIAREHGCRLLELADGFGYARRLGQGTHEIDFWRAAGEGRELLSQVALGPRGEHQAHNAAVTLAIVGELVDQGWSIPAAAQREALEGLCLPGRVEVFPGEPTIVVDTAHNEASAAALADALGELGNYSKRTLVLAASRDKDIPAIVAALAPAFDLVIATRYMENPRAVSPEELAGLTRNALRDGPTTKVETAESPGEAFAAALAGSDAGDLVVVAGSFFIAAELRPIILGRR